MSYDEELIQALSPLGLPIAEKLYEGDEDEFITFVLADSEGTDDGDDEPGAVTYWLQVHYVCPWDMDYSGKVKAIRKALKSAGYTYPSLTDYSDSSARIRHLIFECAKDNNYDLEEDE